MNTGKTAAAGPRTRIATSTTHTIRVGGRDLINELIGEYSYTEMLYFLTCGTMPQSAQTRILDACLVTLMEHGLTPSAVITRLMADSVPEEPQVAISAGSQGRLGLLLSADHCQRSLLRAIRSGLQGSFSWALRAGQSQCAS